MNVLLAAAIGLLLSMTLVLIIEDWWKSDCHWQSMVTAWVIWIAAFMIF
jgi:hypothetical protein